MHDARLSAVEDDVRELREEIAQFVAALLKPVNPKKQFLESKDSKLYGAPQQLEEGAPVKTNLDVLAAQISQAAATQAVMPANREATGVPGDPDGDPSPPPSDKEDRERGGHEKKVGAEVQGRRRPVIGVPIQVHPRIVRVQVQTRMPRVQTRKPRDGSANPGGSAPYLTGFSVKDLGFQDSSPCVRITRCTTSFLIIGIIDYSRLHSLDHPGTPVKRRNTSNVWSIP